MRLIVFDQFMLLCSEGLRFCCCCCDLLICDCVFFFFFFRLLQLEM